MRKRLTDKIKTAGMASNKAPMMIPAVVPPANKSSLQLMTCLTDSEIENKKKNFFLLPFMTNAED